MGFKLARPGVPIILFSVSVHLLWAVLLFGWPDKIGSTPISFLKEWAGATGASFLLLATSVLATLALLGGSILTKGMLLAPQQFFMFASAYSSMEAVMRQSYADGVLRNWQFILSDQFPNIIIAVFHFIGILVYLDSVTVKK